MYVHSSGYEGDVPLGEVTGMKLTRAAQVVLGLLDRQGYYCKCLSRDSPKPEQFSLAVCEVEATARWTVPAERALGLMMDGRG